MTQSHPPKKHVISSDHKETVSCRQISDAYVCFTRPRL